MNFKEVTIEFIEKVFDKLGGPEGAQSLISGDTKVINQDQQFPKFGRLRLKNNDNIDNIIEVIKKDKTITKDDKIKSVLDWPPVGFHESITIDLFAVTPEELGFDEMFAPCATYENIRKKAETFGLQQCPSVVGFMLCLPEHRCRKRKREFYVIGSEPIENQKGEKYLLVHWYGYSGDTKKHELKVFEVSENKPFHIHFKFLFCRIVKEAKY